MSQAKLTSYYNTRKRREIGKNDSSKVDKGKEITFASFFSELRSARDEEPQPVENVCETNPAAKPVKKNEKNSKGTKAAKPKQPKIKVKAQSRGKNVAKESKASDLRTAFELQKEKPCEDEKIHELNVTFDVEKSSLEDKDGPRTPKRNLSTSDDVQGSKKKKNHHEEKEEAQSTIPNEGDKHSRVKRKLMLEESISKAPAENQEPKLSKNLQSALKSLSNSKVEDLKERLKKFDSTFMKLKECQSNKFKITSPIVPFDCKSKDIHKSPEKTEKTIPAYERFASYAVPGAPSLILPNKYKLLGEMFRCCDTVLSILHNRKEVCTFAKLQSGVQDMTKRVFSKSHLGQIKTVLPEAYELRVEKNTPAFINRNPGAPQFELIVSPNLPGNASESSFKKIFSPKKVPSSPKEGVSVSMTPVQLVERKKLFSNALVAIVKKYHQDFLLNLKPPIHVPMEKLSKWHPKFQLDMIPDIKPSELPEMPDQFKLSSAKDVLNKIKGIHGLKKVLQRVSSSDSVTPLDEKKQPDVSVNTKPENKGKITSGLLKGIDLEILQRVRARESVKIIEDMTKTPEEKKRIEMLERIPELVRILRNYFITERKAAVSLEVACKKLGDSYHASLGPDEVRQHIQLMADTFPQWLTLIPIRKGVFMKIDKNKDINIMLQNMPKQ